MAEDLTLGIKVQADGIKSTTKELDGLAAAGAKAEVNTEKVGKAAKKTVAPMKNMRAQAQQASYQFQDIAVQAQMGTNWFTIIGQQGSQLASVFGPSGAVTGALIAFGAILGGFVYKSLNTAGEAMAELEEDMKSLEQNFDNLGVAGKAYVRTLVTAKIVGYDTALEKLNATKLRGIKTQQVGTSGTLIETETQVEYAKRIEELDANIERLNFKKEEGLKLIDDTTDATESLLEKYQEEYNVLGLTGVALAEYKAKQSEANEEDTNAIIVLADEIEKYKEKEERLKESIRLEKVAAAEKKKADAAKVRADAKAKAEEEAAAKRLAKDKESAQARLLQIAQAGMEEAALLESIRTEAKAKVDADFAAELININEQKLAKQQIDAKFSKDSIALAEAEAQAKSDIQQQVLSSMSGVAGQLAGIAEEGSKEAKVLFAMQKAIAIAQIIVATEAAALTASAYMAGAGPIAWLSSVTGIRALGYASAGIVAGTAIAGGRALGGQVRGGESYLVGERGPELLTMGSSGRIATNENLKKAVGSENGQSQANVSVNFSIQANDTAGFDRLLNSRRGQIVSMINQAVNNRGRASIT